MPRCKNRAACGCEVGRCRESAAAGILPRGRASERARGTEICGIATIHEDYICFPITLDTFHRAEAADRVEEVGSSPMRRVVILIVIVGLALTASLFVRTSTAQAQSHADRKVINRIAPVYPELAKRMHMSGVVKLETVIRADGNVKSTKALGGSPVLIEAAMDAVRKWKFEAASEESTEIIQVAFEPR